MHVSLLLQLGGFGLPLLVMGGLVVFFALLVLAFIQAPEKSKFTIQLFLLMFLKLTDTALCVCKFVSLLIVNKYTIQYNTIQYNTIQ